MRSLLFPIVALVRVWRRLRGRADHDLHRPAAPVNCPLASLFERFVAPRVRLPFGSSVLLLARRGRASRGRGTGEASGEMACDSAR